MLNANCVKSLARFLQLAPREEKQADQVDRGSSFLSTDRLPGILALGSTLPLWLKGMVSEQDDIEMSLTFWAVI